MQFLLATFLVLAVARVSRASTGNIRLAPLFEDFSSWNAGGQVKVDPLNFLVAFKQWGGNNGGVLPDNLFVDDDEGRSKVLRMRALGNYYDGPVRGINKDGSSRPDGRRSGSAIASKEYFASGKYEVRAK